MFPHSEIMMPTMITLHDCPISDNDRTVTGAPHAGPRIRDRVRTASSTQPR
jgi:hypothetical protein